jgi:hypothetical protein
MWKDPANIRAYFDWVAKEMNLTSLEQWYTVDRSELIQRKGKFHRLLVLVFRTVAKQHMLIY